MNILKLFESAALAWPRQPAVLAGTTVLCNYNEFLRVVRQYSTWYSTLGLQPGDRIILCMGNRPEYLQLLYAALWGGYTVVPINAKLHGKEVDYMVDHCDAKIVISDHRPELQVSASVMSFDIDHMPDHADLAEAELYPAAADAVAWLFYTSGTTGRPKGAMLTHGNLLAMTLSYRSDVDPVDGTEAYFYGAPISHGAGLYTFAYAASAARHIIPVSGGFEAQEVLDLASALENFCMFAAPTMVSRLVETAEQRGKSPKGIKTIVYGGGPMYLADIQRALEVLGPCFAQIYGQGETPMTITCMTRKEVETFWRDNQPHELGSVGRSHSLVEVRVIDKNGASCPTNQAGEIVVRGPTVMLGYWRDTDATRLVLRDGWLYTGDVGSINSRGYLTLKDRSTDVIISGGSNIYPRELEEVLLEHPGVLEAAVIGVPDSEWGEKVVAYIVTKSPELNDGELDALCLAHVARFKRPKEYVRLDTLPKNNNGKVLKTQLRLLYVEAHQGAGKESTS